MLRQEMIHHIKSLNKYATDKWLDTMTTWQLMAFVHPFYYEFYKSKFK